MVNNYLYQDIVKFIQKAKFDQEKVHQILDDWENKFSVLKENLKRVE